MVQSEPSSSVEFNQTGVTRGLKNRDNFTKNFNAFMQKPEHLHAPDISGRLLCASTFEDIHIGLRGPEELLPPLYAADRENRQRGGETFALKCLETFMRSRGEGYSRGISSPNSAWASCSRLSPFLTFGNISLRRVLQTLKRKQAQERVKRKESKTKDGWLKSLAAFGSRLRWRSHFIQKFESECSMEFHAQNVAYENLRCAEGDWNESKYEAWRDGKTGFPMVDACMRCLQKTGWINFRMRAMLASFATYNLWLDWRGIAPHLARSFLDYEPGIHYPQLQMQAGVTGINAMRVYNVTKQGQDHDPKGVFIKKYLPELKTVPQNIFTSHGKCLTRSVKAVDQNLISTLAPL